jgi:hypothetical protein
VPLVPVGIVGTGTLLPPQASGRRRRRATVIVRIGAPVCVAELAERLVGADGPGVDAATEATARARARVVALAADGAVASGVTPGCGRRARPAPRARCRAR